MSAQVHQSDPRVLNRRTVERDHRRLPDQLRPGMRVLDVGCGTGSITAGIAKLAGPEGEVVGVDRDESLLALARQEHTALSNLRFEALDVLQLPYTDAFDIVTAARVLQWIADPLEALTRMRAAAKPGGHVIVLDYNHDENSWVPEPPKAFQSFYQAFLNWRRANGWNNRIAADLPNLFRDAGLELLRISNDDEVTTCGDEDFIASASIWSDVAQSLGPAMVAAGYLSETGRSEAEDSYRSWVQSGLERQSLCLRTITGIVRA